MNHQDDFITPFEVEHLVQEIREIDIREYGSSEWFRQHERLDKLNIQAHKNAMSSSDDYVMESCIVQQKIPHLIYDLIMTETWKQKIYPMIKNDITKCHSIRSYMAMYHEASVANLLEVFLYHRTAAENCEDSLVELIDYCYRKFVGLAMNIEKMGESAEDQYMTPGDPIAICNLSELETLEIQAKDIDFSVTMTCLSIIRFVTDHMADLPAAIVHQLMEVTDIPLVLVPLLELRPWIRKNRKGETEKFEDQVWTVVEPKDQGKLGKLEAQIWLTIYNLFMTQSSNQKYEITTHRKNNLGRLRKYMNELLIDQLPMLTPLWRALEEMQLMQDNNVKQNSSFVVEVLPEIRARIMNGRNWREIAKHQAEKYFCKDPEGHKEDMKRMMDLYTSDVFEDFMEDPKCTECGKVATQRCSKCKNAWYCSRDCQLRQWKTHKPMCTIVSESIKVDEAKKAEEQAQIEKELDQVHGLTNTKGGEKPKKSKLIQELD